MDTCTDSFWFWFMRPIAEFFGAAALIVAIIMVVVAVSFLFDRKKGK